MAVDVIAVVQRPLTLERLLARAREVVRDLLGGVELPPVTVALDRTRVMGRVAAPGHVASEEELRETLLGPRGVRAGHDGTIDLVDEDGVDVLNIFDSPRNRPWRVVFLPRRDPAGLVLGLAFAIAAALEGAGTVISDDLALMNSPIEEPHELVAATRLPLGQRSFEDASVAYLDQFTESR